MTRRFFTILAVILCIAIAAFSKDKFQHPGPIHLDRNGEKWAEKTLRKLSLDEKVGQMFMIWARVVFMNVDGPQYTALRDAMRKYHVGAFGVSVPYEGGFLYKNEPYETAMLLNQLQRDSDLPLIFAADFERGLDMRLHGVTAFPHAMAFGAAGKPEYAEAFGRITAEEARAVGVHWNFFPVADVNSNPANPIINTRSFGEDPQQVGDLVAAYIRGAKQEGMLTTAKHFPGHGDTDTDTHLDFARVGGDLARLNSVELPPFRRAIEAGVDSVLIAHVTVPALEPDPNRVATTSPAIVTGLLKEKLGFKGLVITDAMDMNGLMRLYYGKGENPSGRAAVEAVKAGNDMILIPQDLDGAYNGILKAVRSGEIAESRIDESVLKILKAKASLGLHRARLVDIEAVNKIVDRPENVATGRAIAEDAIALVRDNGRVLPLKKTGTAAASNPYVSVEETAKHMAVVLFTDDMRSDTGRTFERELRARAPDAQIIPVDLRSAAGMADEVLAAVGRVQTVLAAIYVSPVAGKTVKAGGTLRNTVSLADAPAELLRRILTQAGERTVVIALGNPYLAADFPQAQNYMCTFSNSAVSEAAAVEALFGEIKLHGKLPVTIPGYAARGTGLDHFQRTPEGAIRHEPVSIPAQ